MKIESTRERLARIQERHQESERKKIASAELIGELRAKRALGKAQPQRRRASKVRHRRGFDAARVDHLFPGNVGTPKSINAELIPVCRTLRLRARDEANNNEYVARTLQMVRTNVVGPHGVNMRPDFVDNQGNPDTRDNELVSDAWNEFIRAGVFDVTGNLSLKTACEIFMDGVWRDGGCLAREVRGWKENDFRYAVQLLDIDYLNEDHNVDLGNGNHIVMGVEVNEWGRAVAYHFSHSSSFSNLYGYTLPAESQRMDASEIIHGFFARRPEQVRGYTSLHAAFRAIHQLKGYEEAEVIAARAAAEKMGFIIAGESNPEYEGPGEEQEDGSIEIESGPAEWNTLPHGASVENYDPNHPNSAFPDFTASMKRGYSSGAGVDYSALANDYEGVTFSSLRQAAIEQRALWRQLQQFLIEKFLTPIYRSWLEMSILSGALDLPAHKIKKYHKVVWEPRGFEWVDPKKEAEGNKLLYEMGATSLTRMLAPQGTNPEEVFRERKRERELAEKYGEPLDSKVSEVSSPTHEEDDD